MVFIGLPNLKQVSEQIAWGTFYKLSRNRVAEFFGVVATYDDVIHCDAYSQRAELCLLDVLIKKGTNLRYIKGILEHVISETTEIFIHVLISNINIQNLLDGIDETLNLVTEQSRRPLDNGDIDAIG